MPALAARSSSVMATRTKTSTGEIQLIIQLLFFRQIEGLRQNAEIWKIGLLLSDGRAHPTFEKIETLKDETV